MREFARTFYQSPAWKHCRAAYIKSVGGLCERCLRSGIYTPADTVHHIIRLTPDNISDPSVTLAPENLEAVCRDCHAALHAGGKRYRVDEIGRVIWDAKG